jgi:hypothetical protein
MFLADQNNSDAKELAAQLVLALFVWQFAGRGRNDKLKNFPGGAKWLVIAAFLYCGKGDSGARGDRPKGMGDSSFCRCWGCLRCPPGPELSALLYPSRRRLSADDSSP